MYEEFRSKLATSYDLMSKREISELVFRYNEKDKIEVIKGHSAGPCDLIQDTMDISAVKILSPIQRGIRRNKIAHMHGKVIFKYLKAQNKNTEKEEEQAKIQELKEQQHDFPVMKREVKIVRDDWSHTDQVEDIYTVINGSMCSHSKVVIRTEFFRDELEIFDVEGRKLPFKSVRESNDPIPKKGNNQNSQEKVSLNYNPYLFIINLYSPLQPGRLAVIRLKYKVVSENPKWSSQFLRGLKDVVPFLINDGYFYRFYEIRNILAGEISSFTFTAKLAEGTDATSYVILGIDDQGNATPFDGRANGGNQEDITNYYSEGRDLFFAISGRRLDKIKYLIIFIRISPQSRIFLAVSSIQILAVSVLASLAFVIHSQPFYHSFSLITGLFLAMLTLLLYPERSRLIDTRISVAVYSVLLSVMIVLHLLSLYGHFRLVSDILSIPVLRSLLIPSIIAISGIYIASIFLDWAHRMGRL